MNPENMCISCFKEITDGCCPHCGYVESGNRKKSMLPARMLLSGRYVIGEVLGLDRSSVCFKALDIKKDKIVEVQEYFPRDTVIRESNSANLKIISECDAEEHRKNVLTIRKNARKMMEFSFSNNIVNIYDVFEENNTVYTVNEYLEGMLLGDYVEKCGGRLKTDEAVTIANAVLDGLSLIHKAGLIHRAITPENIILTANNKIKITNFRSLKEVSTCSSKMTVYFSPGYAPPEQYRSNGKQGAFTDIYSVGAVLYKITTGERPVDSINRLSADELRVPRDLNPEIPENVSLAILKAMNIAPEQRFKSAMDFKISLLSKRAVFGADLREEKYSRRSNRTLSPFKLITKDD